MFRKNQDYNNPRLFPNESHYPKYIQKRLKTHWSTVFFEELFSKIDESVFEPLFSSGKGRPNAPVNVLMGLEILKSNFDLSDEELFEELYFNSAYQRALGITNLDEDYISIRTLYHFRKAVFQYAKENDNFLYEKVFQKFTNDVVEKFSIQTGTQRSDSVFIQANIKKMSRIALFHKVLNNFARAIKNVGKNLTPGLENILASDEDSYEFQIKPGEYDTKLKELANLLHTYLERWKKDTEISKTEEFKIAHRLFTEQCKLEQGKVKVKNKNDIDSGSLQNPADPDATYRSKNKKGNQGYACQATETCDKRNPFQLITHIELTKNNVDDSEVFSTYLEKVSQEYSIHTMIVDGGYPSEKVRLICEKEYVDLIATDLRGKDLKVDAITSRSFKFDETGFVTECPKGHRPVQQNLKDNRIVKAKFDSKICGQCPIKERCIAYKNEKISYLDYTASRRWIDERLIRSETEDYKNLCKLRAAVEGTMEKLRPGYLKGRTFFRTMLKVKMRMLLRGTALNFRKVVSNLEEQFFKFLFLRFAYL
jgi:hypothetical protein